MIYIKQIFLVFVGTLIGLSCSLAISASGSENLAEKLSGKILLQVEGNGEAWYVNPEDLRRYYLGRPRDAFEIMRNLGLGISNENLYKITTGSLYSNQANTNNSTTVDPALRYKTYLLKNKVVKAIREDDKEELKTLFSEDNEHAIEYSMKEYGSDEKSRWASLISEAKFLEENGDEAIYRSYVNFNDNVVEIDYHMKQNDEGDWQFLNL